MDKHLISDLHQVSIDRKNDEDQNRRIQGLASEEEKFAGTVNLMRAVQYNVDQNHSARQLPYLVTMISSIIPEGQPNPLGHRQHTSKNYNDVLLSNYMVTKQGLAYYFDQVNPITKQRPKHTVCIDKGTAGHDSSRQVCMTTYIDYNTGRATESLISASRIFEKEST